MFLEDPIFILLIGIIIVVGGILTLKLHPFLALLLGAFVVALITPNFVVENYLRSSGNSTSEFDFNVGERIAVAFGDTCVKLGILIAMAAIIGKCLLESGGAEKIIRAIVRLVGVKNSNVAFLIASFFIGIPVFFDAVIFLMIPLAKAISVKENKNYILYVLAILAGAVMANSLVPPAPGPLYLAGALKIPLGTMIISGIIIGSVTAFVGYLFARWINKRIVIPVRDSPDARLDDIKASTLKDDSQLPSLFLSILPIVVPLIFIVSKTLLNMLMVERVNFIVDDKYNFFFGFINFIGDKNVALSAGGICALLLLYAGRKKEKILVKQPFSKTIQAALMSGGVIILIICAGGAFGTMLKQTGISERITGLTQGYQMALIPLSFFIAAVIRTAQGSATVALITVAGILSGMVEAGNLSFNPVYLALAIGCGAKILPWMNDSGFWVVTKMSNLTEKEALKTFTPMSIIMGVTGLILIIIGATFFPLV